MERLLADIETGEISDVSVRRSDRCTRDPRFLERFLDLADRR
jgi:hypothetical protein